MARDPAPRGIVRAGVSATLRDYLRRYDVPVDRLALAAGIDPQQLGDPEAMLDQLHWFTLVEAAAREIDDTYLAVGFVEQMPWKDLGVLGYVAAHSPTVGAGLANLARYFAVQQTGGRLVLDRVTLEYVVDDPRIAEAGQITEGTFAMTVRLIRDATRDPSWAPREVRFRHDGPPTDRHQAFFRAPIKYRQNINAITLATGDLPRSFTTADAGLLPHLLRHAEDCLARMPKAGDDDVRRAVIAAISAGDPAIDRVAAQLGSSARSLQRRLAADGRSFKAVVDETRLDLAERYLADAALSLTETAFLLGYSDLSAFSRAFRRWTGKTALEFRASRTGSSAASSPRSTRTR